MNLVKKISQAATGYGQAVQTMQDGGFLRCQQNSWILK